MSLLSESVVEELAKRAKRAATRAAKLAAARTDSELDDKEDDNTLPSDIAEPAPIPTSDDVEEVLKGRHIPTSATQAVPVSLRATRIAFSGEKILPITHPEAAGQDPVEVAVPNETDPDGIGDAADFALDNPSTDAGEIASNDGEQQVQTPLTSVPFSWEWKPQIGVNGVGSDRNLRGKSTVLNILMWTLSGRCANFQADVKAWIKDVEVDWQVGADTLTVAFANVDGHAEGTVTLLSSTGRSGRGRVIARFDGEEQFEGVMGAVMMSRLRLEEIPVWTSDREVRHKWPAYASAFTVRADTLDPVVGNVTTLGVRMLQMFIGTDWGPALAATQAAHNEVKAAKDSAESKVSAANDAVRSKRANAEAEVQRLETAVATLATEGPDLEQLLAAATSATQYAREIHNLEREVLSTTAQADTIRLQLRSAKARQHTQQEDVLAKKFFHRMTPSVCPRCTATVTTQRRRAEAEKHECSLCYEDLKLEEVEPVIGDGARSVGESEQPVGDVEALEAALAAADRLAAALNDQIASTTDQLARAEAANEERHTQLAKAEERHQLELALAQARGALHAFEGTTDPDFANPPDPLVTSILEAAEKVLGDWMREGQSPLLAEISADIEDLAVKFGADSLSDVELVGNGHLRIVKGGRPTTYSGVTPGEKLRLKIATAVALIKHGYVAGLGRHPGFLVLDSPAAEEMPEEDLAVLIAALVQVAEQADMQIFVGTRNAGPLLDLLPESNRRVAIGNDYVW